MKRYLLFFGVNILIVATISIIISMLGLGSYMTAYGLNYSSLAIFCLVWGTGGAFISLLLSKFMAKMMMGVKIQELNGPYGHLVQRVHSIARRAKLEKMPEVGVYESSELNAFATGPSRSNSLVAVSTGLLNTMNDEELEGVLAHEVAHIANGDMVTMTLLQGILNAFVMFAARVAAYFISQALRSKDDEGEGLGPLAHMLVVFVLEILFGILSSIVLMWFSRYREFRADSGSASLVGKEKMIAALEALQRRYDSMSSSKSAFATMQISSKSSFMALFTSHPPLAARIEALKRATKFD